MKALDFMNFDSFFKLLLLAFTCLNQSSCSNFFVKNQKDQNISIVLLKKNTYGKLTTADFPIASIEDIIVSIDVEPHSRKIFRRMVLDARKKLSENINYGFDELYIGSDGLRGSSTFRLDRNHRMMEVTYRVDNVIPPYTDIYFLQFTDHGWVQSPSGLKQIELEKFIDTKPVSEYWHGVGG